MESSEAQWDLCCWQRSPATGLHNIRPAGHMRPARSFLPARENSVAENVAKARLRIITCPFRISSTLRRNRHLQPAASLCWSIWPFELSELCRPALHHSVSQPFSVRDPFRILTQPATTACYFFNTYDIITIMITPKMRFITFNFKRQENFTNMVNVTVDLATVLSTSKFVVEGCTMLISHHHRPKFVTKVRQELVWFQFW